MFSDVQMVYYPANYLVGNVQSSPSLFVDDIVFHCCHTMPHLPYQLYVQLTLLVQLTF